MLVEDFAAPSFSLLLKVARKEVPRFHPDPPLNIVRKTVSALAREYPYVAAYHSHQELRFQPHVHLIVWPDQAKEGLFLNGLHAALARVDRFGIFELKVPERIASRDHQENLASYILGNEAPDSKFRDYQHVMPLGLRPPDAAFLQSEASTRQRQKIGVNKASS